MRFLTIVLLSLWTTEVTAFAVTTVYAGRRTTGLSSTTVSQPQQVSIEEEASSNKGATAEEKQRVANAIEVALAATPPTADEVNQRWQAQLEQLREKDAQSPYLSKEELAVVFEDEHIIVIDKPSGVLSVSKEYANLAQSVFDHSKTSKELNTPNQMIVHRLGMDTSGLMVLAKTKAAVRNLNTLFRTRQVERTYEALVCGHVSTHQGFLSLPLMRDYEFPPFMRVSTEHHQRALISLEGTNVNKKLLQSPKDSLTRYQVLSREELQGQPVTRLQLTSISGRTHQLNVHLAAWGHPIVGDDTYGCNGRAAPCGGLTRSEQDELIPNDHRASDQIQKALSSQSTCVHAKSLQFPHPITQDKVSLSVDSPF